MSAQRILICMHDFARGGTERIAIGLAENWTRLGREVVILCGSEEGGLRATVDSRVRVIALEPSIRRGPLSRLRLGPAMAARLADLRPDVIFLPGNFHLPLARSLRRAAPDAVIALKISNPPLPAGLPRPISAALFRYLARGVDGFAVLTAGSLREMVGIVPGRPIMLLHDPIYVQESEACGPATGCNIVWAGRLEPQKDAELALRTIAVLKDRLALHMTMLGDGSQRRHLAGRIAAMGLGGHVTLAGAVPVIDPYLSRASALLMSSHYEGQPAVVGEALFHGVPIVSTDCSPMLHEVMTVREAGRIVASRSPQDLAAALLAVCQAARPRREVLRGLVAAYEPGRCAAAYLDWFDRLVAHG